MNVPSNPVAEGVMMMMMMIMIMMMMLMMGGGRLREVPGVE